MTRFYEFVHSPYHNKHGEVQALVGYLNKIYPQFTEKKCDRFRVFRNLYPKQKHNQPNLALLFTYAFRLSKEFLSMEQCYSQKENQALHLLTALRHKEHHPFYQKKLQQTQQQLVASLYRDSFFYQQQLALGKESDLGHQLASWKGINIEIQEKQHYLDYYYLGEKLKDACELEVRSKILCVQFELQFIENILEVLQKNWERYKNIPPIAVYFHLYRMIRQEDTARYYEALPIIEQNSRFFQKKELKDIYTYVQNYCIKQINESNAVFMEELLKIYKIQLERKLLHDEKEQLSEWHYKNIVTLGLRLKERDWVFKFIEQYKDEIPFESRENAYRFNRAAYAYNVADYDKVLELLLQVEYTNIQYGLGARWLLLRTYYDLEETTSFFALCDSFRLYLQRNKLIAAFKKKGNEQAIRLARKAFQIKLEIPYQHREKTEKDITKLRIEIADTETVFNRGWLEEKVEEISVSTK